MAEPDRAGWSLVWRASLLSLGAAIALGIARFSYALLLPPMKAALGWSFAQAGALNTANAFGYLLGALLFPALVRRVAATRLFVASCAGTSLVMAAAALTVRFDLLLLQRMLSGVGSAFIFVGGGILASRLATAHPRRSGLVLGLFYGGAGWGIVLSALVVPGLLAQGWQPAWVALAAACALCAAGAAAGSRGLGAGTAATGASVPIPPLRPARFAPLLAAYGLFGVGYIGYMTFIVALLRSTGMAAGTVTAFYVLLGLATAASGPVWSRLLHRARGGGALGLFCFLLAVATLVPALSTAPAAAFASGALFGVTFLAVVASTTAFVRHNLPPARWPAGIAAFTVVFALGQIVGPVAMGAISDGAGLSRGLMVSAGILLAASVVAAGQRPLGR